ncbi:hypothetical protein NDN08_002366 [Rhodosorus marinus]|uniref:Carbohydrate binding module family 25 domain-containing protein n=1 Tax=Rhodosorus marinus TaxID=101924 RepID=A0AAV8UZ99_9RHOD|nr:hypothetical protein NDN08_002366 [Rhodosorus marinus]
MLEEPFRETPFARGWIEIFHSMPSWDRCFIVFRKDGKEWKKNARYELRDASDIKPGFRVFRVKAWTLEFYLTNGSSRNWENNSGKNYSIEESGRYLVSYKSMSRVGEADIGSCIRAMRKHDRFIELIYQPPTSWLGCSIIYSKDNEQWLEAPGEAMIRIKSKDPQLFMLRTEAHHMNFAFFDGVEEWDSNMDENYKVGLPGKYFIRDGVCKYVGPSEMDHLISRMIQ